MVLTTCRGGGTDSDATPVIDPGDGGQYSVDLRPADFVPRIDNPFLPFAPGARWVYQSDDGEERIEVTVLAETRSVQGINVTIVRDTATEDGEIVEDTYDWYAQDRDGNVWYLGEDSTAYEDGKAVSHAGSWEAGINGAQAGIIMRATPVAGESYRQEYYAGEAEDMAQVLRLDGAADVPFGKFTGLLVVAEWTPLEPKVIEHKYYARGIGLVAEVAVAGESGRIALVSFTPGAE